MWLLVTKRTSSADKGEYGLETKVSKFSSRASAVKARLDFLTEHVHGPKLDTYLKQFPVPQQLTKLIELEKDRAQLIDLDKADDGLLVSTSYWE